MTAWRDKMARIRQFTPPVTRAVTVSGYRPTYHLQEQLPVKGITLKQIYDTLTAPDTVSPARGENKRRFTGSGIAVIVDDTDGVIITAYPDKVTNPFRPDQRDERAMQYARRNGISV